MVLSSADDAAAVCSAGGRNKRVGAAHSYMWVHFLAQVLQQELKPATQAVDYAARDNHRPHLQSL